MTGAPPPEFDVIYGAYILLQSFCKNPMARIDFLKAVYEETEGFENSATWLRWLDRKAVIYELPRVGDMLYGRPWRDEDLKSVVKSKILSRMEREMREEFRRKHAEQVRVPVRAHSEQV